MTKEFITVHPVSDGCQTLSDIDKRDRHKGFSKCGYHFVIRSDGTWETGRSLDEASVHDPIRFARQAVAVAVVGPELNPVQRESLQTLADGLGLPIKS